MGKIHASWGLKQRLVKERSQHGNHAGSHLLLTLFYMFRLSQLSSGMPINEKEILKTITIGGHGGKVLQSNFRISCR